MYMYMYMCVCRHACILQLRITQQFKALPMSAVKWHLHRKCYHTGMVVLTLQ